MRKISHFIIALTLISPLVYPFQFASAQSIKDGDLVLADNISGTLVKMQDDAGALEALANVFGADSAIYGVFKMTLKYGDFIARLKSGNATEALIVMIDAIETMTQAGIDMGVAGVAEYAGIAKGVNFISGAMTLGTWVGNKALLITEKEIINRGYWTYKKYKGDETAMEIWWSGGSGSYVKDIWGEPTFFEKLFAGGAKMGASKHPSILTMGSLNDWVGIFNKLSALENLTDGDAKNDQKAMKKKAIVLYIKLKWPSVSAEALANLILSGASQQDVRIFVLQNIELFRKETKIIPPDASASIHGTYDQARQYIIKAKENVLKNKITYTGFLEAISGVEVTDEESLKYITKNNIDDRYLNKIRKEQQQVLAAAYGNSPFHDDFAALRMFVQRKIDEYQKLNDEYKKSYPGGITGKFQFQLEGGELAPLKERLGYTAKSLWDNKPTNPSPGVVTRIFSRIFGKSSAGADLSNQYKSQKNQDKKIIKFFQKYIPQYEKLINKESDEILEQRYNSLVNYIKNNVGVLSYGYAGYDGIDSAAATLVESVGVFREKYAEFKSDVLAGQYFILPISRVEIVIGVTKMKKQLAEAESDLASISGEEKIIAEEYKKALEAYDIFQKMKKTVESLKSVVDNLKNELDLNEEENASTGDATAKYQGQELQIRQSGDFAYFKSLLSKPKPPKDLTEKYKQKLAEAEEKVRQDSTELEKLGYGEFMLQNDYGLEASINKRNDFIEAYYRFLDIAAAVAKSEEKETQALQGKKAREDALTQEQVTDKFNVPFGQKVTPTTTPTPTAKPKPTFTTKPSMPTQSNLPSGYSYVPAETEEMLGFSFSAQNRADMGTSDFFWNDVIYTVNGSLDLGSKSINDVTSVPTSGYEGHDSYQPEVGHVYAIKTRGGKYGIIQIVEIRAGLETGNRGILGARLYFYWRYQPDGSNSFTSTKATLTPTPTQAPAEKTVEQIQCQIFNSDYGGNPDGCPVGTFIATGKILTIVNISGNSVTFEDDAKKQTIKNSGDTMQVASNATAVVRVQNGRLYFDNVIINWNN